MIWKAEIPSPVGRLQVFATHQVLSGLVWPNVNDNRFQQAVATEIEAVPVFVRLQRQLDEYFLGERFTFDLPLDIAGTDFQRDVWQALRTIPYGQTRSYSEQAIAVGRPRAVRAVGAANGRNPISIVIPCHRVIGKNGRLTGFAGGTVAKRQLLELEQATMNRRLALSKRSSRSQELNEPTLLPAVDGV